MSNNPREERLRSMPIPRLLFNLSLPATIAMFTNALYNFVDAAIVGHGVGKLGLAGLSIAFPLQMLIGAVGLMFGIGGASMASRFLGAGKREEADHTIGTGLSFVAVLGLLSFLLIEHFLDQVLGLVGATPDILPYAREYSRIVLIGFIPLSLTMAANNYTRAEGNAKMSMAIMLSGAITNMILDPIFVFGFKWGMTGAAAATVIGQVLSAIIALSYIFSRRSAYTLRPRHFLPRPDMIRQIFSLGIPTFLRQAGVSTLVIVVNNVLRHYSSSPEPFIAVMGVINRLMMFALMPVFGIGQGMQPIVGFNYGARQYPRVREVVGLAFRAGTVVATLFWLMFMLMPASLMRVFNADPELVGIGVSFLRVVFLVLPLVAFQVLGSVYFQAMGKVLPSFLLSTSRQFLLLLPLVMLFTALWGIPGMKWAFPVSDFVTVIITFIWYEIDSRKHFTSGNGM